MVAHRIINISYWILRTTQSNENPKLVFPSTATTTTTATTTMTKLLIKYNVGIRKEWTLHRKITIKGAHIFLAVQKPTDIHKEIRTFWIGTNVQSTDNLPNCVRKSDDTSKMEPIVLITQNKKKLLKVFSFRHRFESLERRFKYMKIFTHLPIDRWNK